MLDMTLVYLTNHLGDLVYWRDTHDVDDLNYVTCGTPSFESLEEVDEYLSTLQEHIDTLKSKRNPNEN